MEAANKKINLQLDLKEAVRKVQAHGIMVYSGLVVGFDTDDLEIFEQQELFLSEAGITVPMIGMLVAAKNTKLWKNKGTSYIPPVKQIFYTYNLSRLRMPLIFGNTSPVVLCTFLRRILLPEDEPAPDRYGYPASPCAQRQDCRSSLIQAWGSARGPGLSLQRS